MFDKAIRIVIDPAVRHPPPTPPPKPDTPIVDPLQITDARFASFVNNKEFSDVIFKFADKRYEQQILIFRKLNYFLFRELHAHKIILSAASPIFQKIFIHRAEPPATFTMKTTNSNQSDATKNRNSFDVFAVKRSVGLLPFHGARYGATASTIDGTTYIIGGVDIRGTCLTNVLRFGKSNQ